MRGMEDNNVITSPRVRQKKKGADNRLKAESVVEHRIKTKVIKASEDRHLLTRPRGCMFPSSSKSTLSLEGTTSAGKQNK